MYARWRKIRGLDKDDPIEKTGQLQSSFKEFEKKSNNDDTYFSLKESESPHSNTTTNPTTQNKKLKS